MTMIIFVSLVAGWLCGLLTLAIATPKQHAEPAPDFSKVLAAAREAARHPTTRSLSDLRQSLAEAGL